MQILLLGATGRTGEHLLKQALERGHAVKAVVRDRNKIKITHPGLTIFEAERMDELTLDNAMKGCDAIISALNISRNSDWPWAKLRTGEYFLSETMKSILSAATRRGIRRVMFISAWGVSETKKDLPGWFRWLIDHSNIRYPYLDHGRQEDVVKSSTLEWTAIRAAGLTNSKKSQSVIVSFNNQPKPNWTISRRTVAAFILDALEQHSYVNQLPVISAK